MRGLRAAEKVLHAVYVSPVTDHCDVENVLFYNIGTGAFRQAMSNGVRFERSFSRVPVPPRWMTADAQHYQAYRLQGAVDGFSHWVRGATVATWDGVELPPLTSSTKVAAIWRAITMARSGIQVERTLDGRFGLHVVVEMPQPAAAQGVSSLMKPLLDGLISAFHRHDGSREAELSQRLATQTGSKAHEIARLLGTDGMAALGTRRLLWVRGRGVQWNPRDDDCVAGDVAIRASRGERWSISGALFEVKPV
ncbi:MAG TPA: hypothetical protein VEZ14_02985 [Dehalococcoidia bacterium]|nr:hypothetical protein [Dehalococcoidia bacterium]